jgi:rhamnose transport system permease protein
MSGARHRREIAAATAYAGLLVVVTGAAPDFFSLANLRDLAVNNAAGLIVALGMTVVVLAGEIDISVGSQFAVCTVAAGVFAKAGIPMPLVVVLVMAVGACMGALNGALVGLLRLPSIIVTLAMLVAWRDALQWITEGAWVQGLPPHFQWFGLGQHAAQLVIVGVPLALAVAMHWTLHGLRGGRAVYAVGSNAEAARLAGIDPRAVVFGAFTFLGALVGLAGTLDAVRFTSLPSSAGVGLELAAIAAVVVGGTSITGGRGTVAGTFVGVALLGTIGTALTFLRVNPFWEKAIQGIVILAALGSDVAFERLEHHVGRIAAVRAPGR